MEGARSHDASADNPGRYLLDLLNIRGMISNSFPLALSYAIISMDYMYLYIDEKKIDEGN